MLNIVNESRTLILSALKITIQKEYDMLIGMLAVMLAAMVACMFNLS